MYMLMACLFYKILIISCLCYYTGYICFHFEINSLFGNLLVKKKRGVAIEMWGRHEEYLKDGATYHLNKKIEMMSSYVMSIISTQKK